MTRAALALVVLGLASGACSKKRIAECDALLSAVERINNCASVPANVRKGLVDSAQTIRTSIQMLEDAGGPSEAPPDLANAIRDACKTQDATLRTTYPDCVK